MSDVEIRPPIDLDALADVLFPVHVMHGYPVKGVADPRVWLELSDSLAQCTVLLYGEPVGHVAVTRPVQGEAAPAILVGREGMSFLGPVGGPSPLAQCPRMRVAIP